MKGLGVFLASSGCHSGTRVERQINTVPADAKKHHGVYLASEGVYMASAGVFGVLNQIGCLFGPRGKGVYLAHACKVFIWRPPSGVYLVLLYMLYILYMLYMLYLAYVLYVLYKVYVPHMPFRLYGPYIHML